MRHHVKRVREAGAFVHFATLINQRLRQLYLPAHTFFSELALASNCLATGLALTRLVVGQPALVMNLAVALDVARFRSI